MALRPVRLGETQRATEFHIDTPWSRALVNVVVVVDETTQQNGATVIIPGSHVAIGTSYQDGVLAPGELSRGRVCHKVLIPLKTERAQRYTLRPYRRSIIVAVIEDVQMNIGT
jgi:hypothetical protein